jgi:hypothetical protein
VASRPRFSASRRKLPWRNGPTIWCVAGRLGTSRRDANWRERDGRAPYFNCVVPAKQMVPRVDPSTAASGADRKSFPS